MRFALVLLSILLASSSFTPPLHATDACTIQVFAENFDGVSGPSLPEGWVASPTGLWKTTASIDTPPNAAWGQDRQFPAVVSLESPAMSIPAGAATLTFRNQWSHEGHPASCLDGGVLEIKVDAGPYVDTVSAGGAFLSGGYTGTIATDFGNPLGGRSAWCGSSPSFPNFVTTEVRLPQSALGHVVMLRWSNGSNNFNSLYGQVIDSLTILGADSDPCEGSSCDDGNDCTLDTCGGCNGCVHSPALNCDDGNVCTTDACVSGLQCVHTNNTAPCQDGVACTTGDTCGGDGVCHAGTGPLCDDNNPCTFDTCIWPNCSHVLADGSPCSDGNECSLGDYCYDGLCQRGPGTLNCDDANPCTADACFDGGCTHANVAGACNDSDACTTSDTCQNGICSGSPIVCTASDPCHLAGTCSAGACSNPPVQDGIGCDDGIPCTSGEICVAGACSGGAPNPPGELHGARFSDGSMLVWDEIPGSPRYDVLRGEVSAFPVGPGGGDEICFDERTSAWLIDGEAPAAGTGFWYLVRASTECGVGTFGSQADGVPRVSTSCP
ncbi:MAG TPA: hypothetical protein VFO11_08990 [Candidatus Polarisedimenticolaceae bacterium]|nr:hypothetical protein [Candidatus Polarisedimenticolaceae bacterium]